MSIQTSLEKQLQQRELLEELIKLKAKEIHDNEFLRNTYVNAELLGISREKVSKEISSFIQKVYKAFSDCF